MRLHVDFSGPAGLATGWISGIQNDSSDNVAAFVWGDLRVGLVSVRQLALSPQS
jgi:hypothetical protein